MKGAANGLRYAVSFEEKIFGAKCSVEVAVDLASGETSVVVSMLRFLSPEPAFRITRDDLAGLASFIRTAKSRSSLLDERVEGSMNHQMDCSIGGASLITFKPIGKPARFNLSIGLFHQEGPLNELSAEEVDQAVAKLDSISAKVSKKAAAK